MCILKKVSVIFFYCFIVRVVLTENFSYVDLPESHLTYYFNSFPKLKQQCVDDDDCIYKEMLNSVTYDANKCWGYETTCKLENAFSKPVCSNEKPAWIKTKEDHLKMFYSQSDFGYIRHQISDLMILCTPLFQNDSMLECSKNLRYCHGRNIMINFTDLLSQKQPARYKMDVLKHGQIGGYCTMNKKLFEEQMDHMSALQSWAPELRNFVELNERPIETDKCDVVFDKPVFIMKLDASNNMYHHFCDFFNLYASLHVNMTHPNVFSKDNQIIIWETYNYDSPFSVAFNAFSNRPVVNIKSFAGKIVCFKNLMLPLLPRMIFGLYYNTPIVNGCEKSGLFQAFSEFMLHRLNVPLHTKRDDKIRITFLERKTKFRQILNADELIAALRKNQSYSVQTVQFERHVKFSKQLEITRNTDIFIGMHGAGLAHLLFLPQWATLFEIYHCEDPACYRDLARIRGVNYMTWENKDKLMQQDEGHHPDGGAHAKFTNYSFDKQEFLRLVNKAADYVLNHDEYREFLASNFEANSHNEL